MLPIGNYDSGLYHIGTIRWINEYPIALGLGNLHSRFAFNQSYFGLVGMLNFFPLWNKGYAMIGPLLLILSMLTLLEIRKYFLQLPGDILIGCLLICAFFSADLSSPLPDLGVGLIEIVLFAMCCSQIKQYEMLQSIDNRLQVTIIPLLGLLICIKLSGLVFALGVLLITGYLSLLCRESKRQRSIKLRAFELLMALLMIHVLTGYLLSGTPLYPSSIGGIWKLPWAMSPDVVSQELAWAYSWARSPGINPEQIIGYWQGMLPWEPGNWIINWLKVMPLSGKAAFAITSIAILLHHILKKCSPNQIKALRLNILYIPLVGAFGYWFFNAPDLRFLGSAHWLLALLSIHLLISSLSKEREITSKLQPKIMKFGIYLSGMIIITLQIQKPNLGQGWPQEQKTLVRSEKTLNGMQIYIPIHGDQCNTAPLPCTPYFDPSLSYTLAYSWWPIFTRSK